MAKPLWALEGHEFISFFITVTCLPSLNKGVGGPLSSREHKKYFSSVVVPCARCIENVVHLFAGEKELRTRIKDLIRYRKNGITKLSGIYRLLQRILANLKVVSYFFNTKLWHWAKYSTLYTGRCVLCNICCDVGAVNSTQLWSVYLKIISRAWIGSESMGYWLRGHEGERNNGFSKIQLVGQKINIENKKTFS